MNTALIEFALTGLGGFLLLCLGEFLWRNKHKHGEGSRKFAHISIGIYIAFWPLYLDWNTIRLISILLLLGLMVTKYFKFFKTVHSIDRNTWGEFSFALSIGLLTFITSDPIIYAAAVLHMSLADGWAAIVGTRYGRGNTYHVFGQRKSLVGSLTFFIISVGILSGYVLLGGPQPMFSMLLAVPIIATLIENVATRGIDNLLVPLFIAAMLTNFS